MIKRSGVVAAACSLTIGALAPLFVAVHSPAYAQSAAVELCDRIAADPTDPDKPAGVKGVAADRPSRYRDRDQILQSRCGDQGAGRSRAARSTSSAGPMRPINNCPKRSPAYRKAADKGCTSAMVELGVMLANGTGVAKDEVAGAHAVPARRRGRQPARRHQSCRAFGNGGAPSDPVEARALLEKAAATNSAEAEFELGLMLANGTGGPQDDVAARAMFASAAAQSHAAATDWLGSFEEAGRGGPKDKDAAKADYESRCARRRPRQGRA